MTLFLAPYFLGREEMDLKVLQFKNKKLGQSGWNRDRHVKTNSENGIEKLEKRQATDDATSYCQRYWAQVDAAFRRFWLLIQRLTSDPLY